MRIDCNLFPVNGTPDKGSRRASRAECTVGTWLRAGRFHATTTRLQNDMGGKKKASNAELLARGKKTVEQAITADDSWEDASALLAQEQAARDAADAAEKAATKQEQTAAKQEQTAVKQEPPASKQRKKKTKGEAAATAPAPALPVKKLTPMEEKREEIRRKVEAAQKARAEETRNAFKKESAADRSAGEADVLGTREQLASERRQARAAANGGRGRATKEEEKPILAESTPSEANAQHPDETLEEWTAVGDVRGYFERTRVGFHPGVSCDQTGKVPIIGFRFMLRREHLDATLHPYGYDVCEEAWLEMAPATQETFERIPPPNWASDDAPLLQPLKRHFAYQSSGL
jgi:hypothetical protein